MTFLPLVRIEVLPAKVRQRWAPGRYNLLMYLQNFVAGLDTRERAIPQVKLELIGAVGPIPHDTWSAFRRYGRVNLANFPHEPETAWRNEMTLILSVATEQYVALASDRRVTVSHGKQITKQEDTDTKTFNLCGHFLMGFTGLARIDGHRVERWVADVLVGVEVKNYFKVLKEEINSAFRRLGHVGRIPHAFLAVGFAAVQQTGDLRPLSVVISNSLDQQGRFTPTALSSDFKLHAELLGNRRQQVLAVGWPVSDDDMATLEYRVRVAARGEPTNPILSLPPLVLALRATADRSRDHVGHSVLFASLPKKAVPAPYVSVGKSDARNQPTSLYLPQQVRNARAADIYAPALVCPQMSMIGLQISSQGPIGPTEGY